MRAEISDSPSGTLVPTLNGQQAFVPHALPREVRLSPSLVYLLDAASSAAARLAGVGETIQNPNLLIRPLLFREAVLSSRIEGTQASVSELFLFEVGDPGQRAKAIRPDIHEVINYVKALEYGIERVKTLPISVRLINEVHSRLLENVRGGEKRPGELRTTQVWIAPPATPIEDARFVPPPPTYLRDLLGDWESFANESIDMPPLVRCALMHYQFEAIHPYLDGNGRIGRLLIVLYLCASEFLPMPFLYLSAYFEENRDRYYDELYRVSATGDWEHWLAYFLTGVAEQAKDALIRVRRLRDLHDEYRQMLQTQRETGLALQLLDELFANPFMTTQDAANRLGVTFAGARGILLRLERLGIVEQFGSLWPRVYLAKTLLEEVENPSVQ